MLPESVGTIEFMQAKYDSEIETQEFVLFFQVVLCCYQQTWQFRWNLKLVLKYSVGDARFSMYNILFDNTTCFQPLKSMDSVEESKM